MRSQGVETIICMHLTEKAIDRCRDIGLNVISTGHMSSDSVGLNLLCDTLEKEGVEIVPVSGFVRVPRMTH
jgi:putative NIF3 family GTP cyclohydrolase 1 type 2